MWGDGIPGVCGYEDDGRSKIDRLAEAAVNSDSADDAGEPVNVAFGQSVGKRLNVLPTGDIPGRKA